MAIVDAALAPPPGTPVILDGWQIISTLVAPAAAPLIAMVILFDIMMSRIRASDSSGTVREKFRKIAWIETFIVIILVVIWLPYFRLIGQ